MHGTLSNQLISFVGLSDSMKDLKSSVNEFYLNLYDQCKQLHPKDHLLAVRRASRVVKVMKDKVVQRRATLLSQTKTT